MLNARTQTVAAAAAIIAASLISTEVLGSDDQRRTGNLHPLYISECGSCHVAFPPKLLAGDSWRAVMAGLDKHFGSDASLDAATVREIETFLTANAGSRKTLGADGKPLLRITETTWFQKEHREGHGGLRAGVFHSDAVKTAANCSACHRNAADGDYSERSIRIPQQPSDHITAQPKRP